MTANLITRLEAAKGPDRELDAEIAKHLGWTTFIFGGAGPCWKDTNGRIMAECPHYTGSIDAARTISSDTLLVHASDIGAKGLPLVRLVMDTSKSPIIEHHGIARTLELAWCIAALKAREESNAD